MFPSLFAFLERRFGDPAEQMTRREMFKASLAAGSAMLLSTSVARAAAGQAGRRVVVIGAGLGGLAAALELVAVGYEVTVIEARSRLGGRVHTIDNFIKNKFVEAGGEMIGLNHPTWAAYAGQMGLNLVNIVWEQDADMPVVLGGERLSNDAARALWKEMKQGLSRINADAERADAYEPWKTPGARKFDERTTAEWIDSLKVSDRCKQAMTIQLTAINGMPPAQQSYLANLAMVKGGGVEKYWTHTDALHCEGGNQQLPEEMSDELGPQRFILHQPATEVKLTDDGVTVTVADGQKVEADDVVLAVPISTWDRIKFDPPLPKELAPQMGINTKFFAHVKTRFWEKDNLAARGLTDGPVCLTWEGTSDQPEEGGVCLIGYAGGPESEKAIDWTDDERQKNYREALERLYPGFNDEFVAGRFINWRADPLARGSYSFPAPGQVLAHGPTLTNGLGRLHFAGEHCCYAFIGYMEGALQSGVRLARRLAERDGLIKKRT